MKIPLQHIPKPWGFEEIICNTEDYCGKFLHIKEGQRTSWHYHKIKDEHFHVQRGRLVLYYSEDMDFSRANVVTLNEGETAHIPVGTVHRLEAQVDTVVLEISTTHFDSDSIRLS